MTEDATPAYSLAHPVYLDVPMMVSFLAHLEGGVSVGGAERTTITGSRERLLKGRGGFRARLWAIDADLGGEKSSQQKDESQTESETERHHTAASLFNVLYSYLREDGMVRDVSSEADLEGIEPGAMVEIYGQYLGNPLEEVLAFVRAFMPYYESLLAQEKPEPDAQPRKAAKSGNPAKRAAPAPAVDPTTAALAEAAGVDPALVAGFLKQQAEQERKATEFGMKLMTQMSDDIQASPVHDLLFVAENLSAVITVDSDFYSETTKESLRSGYFRIVGKVTKILRPDETINLARRTVLGVAGVEETKKIISGFTDESNLSLENTEPIVEAPAVQILPMAIFI
jgi:hypothetical protein